MKEIEKASDIDLRRGQKDCPLASLKQEVIYPSVQFSCSLVSDSL